MKIRTFGNIAFKTSNQQIPNKIDVNNYRLRYVIQQWTNSFLLLNYNRLLHDKIWNETRKKNFGLFYVKSNKKKKTQDTVSYNNNYIKWSSNASHNGSFKDS